MVDLASPFEAMLPVMASPERGRLAPSQRRWKRARFVCQRCHEKKVKCDVQYTAGQEFRCCENCALTGSECRGTAARPPLSSPIGGQIRNSGLVGTSTSDGHSQLHTLHQIPPTNQGFFTGHSNAISYDGHHADTLLPADNRAPDHYGIIPVSPNQPPASTGVQSQNTSPSHIHNLSRRDQNVPPQNLRSGSDPTVASYLGESGYLQIFSQDHRPETPVPCLFSNEDIAKAVELPPAALQVSYMDTYFEYCYPWCPIFDRDSPYLTPGMTNSVLLKQALAFLGSDIDPPLLKHASSATYYNRAKTLFYSNHEKNPIISLSALLLFYWWGPAPPNMVCLDTVWFWTGLAIRQAQEIGLHREPKSGQVMRLGETPELRRRIWWTLFARERLTSICEGRPCIIDPEDCNVREPTLEDFPEPRDERAEMFIYWVRLCAIIGRVGKHISRGSDSTPLPIQLSQELIEWVKSLPEHLQLPISSDGTTRFNRHVHQLHLPYLTAITLLNLSKSPEPLPKAYTAAVVAASCVARIFEDFLARGSIRFLQGMCGWYISIAILALLHARQIECLTETADMHIRTLRIALQEMAKKWHSSKMFVIGFQRLLDAGEPAVPVEQVPVGDASSLNTGSFTSGLADPARSIGINWLDYFPFATLQTSPLIAILLVENSAMTPFFEMAWPYDLSMQLQGLFEPLEDNNNYMFDY